MTCSSSWELPRSNRTPVAVFHGAAGRPGRGPFVVPCLAALFVAFATPGCKRPQASPGAAPVAPERVTVYVNPERLLAYHPDASRLEHLDRMIRRAGTTPTPAVVEGLREPPEVELPLPDPPTESEAPPGPEVERARQAVREDFEIRRLARPDEEEERYRRALERLRRRYLELRREPRTAAEEEDLALALRNARRISELLEQLRALEEKPEDRLFYNAAQLRRRRDLYRLTQQDLEAIRREEARRLQAALGPDPWARRAGETPREIPPEQLARIEQQREELRKEALAELDRLEQNRIVAVESATLPPPQVERSVPELPLEPQPPVAEGREAMRAQVRAAGTTDSTERGGAPDFRDTVAALRAEREQLRTRLLREVRAVAAVAARERGMIPTFEPGKGPDRTALLAEPVRRLLSAGGGGKE